MTNKIEKVFNGLTNKMFLNIASAAIGWTLWIFPKEAFNKFVYIGEI